MAFPARTFRRLRKYHFVSNFADDRAVSQPLQRSQIFQSSDHNADTVEMRTVKKCNPMDFVELKSYGEKIYHHYLDAINLWTLPFSFIPGTSQYKYRIKLEVINHFLQRKIAENLAERQKNTPDSDTLVYEKGSAFHSSKRVFSYQRKLHTYFPGWTKTILVVLLAVLLIGLVLTGIGALVSLGVLGTTASGMMLSSGIVFSQTTVGGFLFSFTTSAYFIGFGSAVAGIAASLLFHEWLRPGYLSRFIPFVGRHATQVNSKHSLFDILVKVLISQDIRESKYSSKIQNNVERWSRENIIRFIVNPIRWVEAILQLAQGLVFRLAEIKSERREASSFWRAAFKQIVGEYLIGLILAPIGLVKYITDMPFLIAKSVIYELPRTLYRTTCGEVPKDHRDEISPPMQEFIVRKHAAKSQEVHNGSVEETSATELRRRRTTSDYNPPLSQGGLAAKYGSRTTSSATVLPLQPPLQAAHSHSTHSSLSSSPK